MKKKILVLCGGASKERVISLETGKEVVKELKKNKYRVISSEPDNKLLKNIASYKPDIIFNALHGQFGEDGYIQTILETTKKIFLRASGKALKILGTLICEPFNAA